MKTTTRHLHKLAAILVLVSVAGGTGACFLFNRASGTDSALVGLPLDDSWIHLVYARNLAQRGELSYNPGEPETGFSSPLWVVLLSPFSTLDGAGPALAAKLLSLSCGIALCLVIAALTRRLAGDLAGTAAGLAVALDPALTFSSVSGMEVCLAGCLQAALLLALAQRRVTLAGVLFGLAFLSRPESAALVAVVAPWVWVQVQEKKTDLRTVAAGSGLALALVTSLLVYCWAVTGRPFPNTFYVKTAWSLWPGAGLKVVGSGVLASSLLLSYGAGVLLMLPGAWWLVRQRAAAGLALVAAPWVLWVATAMTRSFPAGETQTYYFTRYFHPALPLLAVPLGCGVSLVANQLRQSGKRAVNALVALTCLLGAAALLVVQFPRSAARFSWNTRNTQELQETVGRWIALHTSPDAVIATNDAGAIRFFGERRVIDLMGLNYHPAVPARRKGLLPLGQIMRSEQPTHLAVIPSWFPAFERSPLLRPVFTTRAEHYTVAAAPQDRFVVYEVLSSPR